MPRNCPCPRKRKLAGKPLIVDPPVMPRARPRATASIPRVTTKDGSPPKALMTPFTEPTRAPARRANTTESAGLRPMVTMNCPVSTLTSATTDPTERSMPPIRMTKVIPTLMMRPSPIWRPTTVRLPAVKKYGDAIERKITSRMTTAARLDSRAVTIRTSRSRARSAKPGGRGTPAAPWVLVAVWVFTISPLIVMTRLPVLRWPWT